MAATPSVWAKPGAWALDSEENETELLQQHKADLAPTNGHSNGAAAAETADFPSLSAAAATKTKKKKKTQTLSLHEFTTYTADKPTVFQPKGLTPEEMMALPTAPRERTAEELDRSKGFRSYGIRDEQPRREGRFNRDSDREFAPSRADETDNWASAKKPIGNSSFDRRERGERSQFFTDSQSRADDVDNWASKKSFVPSEPRRFEKRMSFGSESGDNGADSANWGKRKEEEGRKGAFDSLRDRRSSFDSNGADADNWGKKREEVSGAANGGRPKLNLKPRTLPPPVIEVVKVEIPPVSEVQKDEIAPVVKPKASNPFGEARPREEVLKEKGQDWKEIEEKLEATKIKEVISIGTNDVHVVAKRGFWGANGRDRAQIEDKTERAWRKPGSVGGSRPQSAGGSENGTAENTENGTVENTENGHAEERNTEK